MEKSELQKEVEDFVMDVGEKFTTLCLKVQDTAETEEEYHECLKLIKLLQGSPLTNVAVRSTCREYRRRFGD